LRLHGASSTTKWSKTSATQSSGDAALEDKTQSRRRRSVFAGETTNGWAGVSALRDPPYTPDPAITT
jgi:hypothetical protein